MSVRTHQLPTSPSFQVPAVPSPRVQLTREWRAQMRAEESAAKHWQARDGGQTPPPAFCFVEKQLLFRCEICGICIAPSYYETEGYLLLVVKQRLMTRDDQIREFDRAVLLLCGHCACKRQVPESCLILYPDCWNPAMLADLMQVPFISQETLGRQLCLYVEQAQARLLSQARPVEVRATQVTTRKRLHRRRSQVYQLGV